MKKTGYWVIRTYRSGMIGEKIKYWVPGEKPSKSERRLRTDIRHQQRNEANAVKRMTRLVHANFTGDGAEIVLTYDDEHMERLETVCAGSEDFEDALYHAGHKELRLWLRRARRACAAEGVEFRYIAVTSDRDGKTGDMVRVHHHVIVNEEAAEIVIGKWGRGITKKKLLSSEPDKMEFVGYLLQQVRRSVPDEKKYIPSRNLAHPQPKDRICEGKAEIQLPRHAMLLHRSEYTDGKPQYIRYILPEYAKQEVDEENGRTIYL